MAGFRTRKDGSVYPVKYAQLNLSENETYTRPTRCKGCGRYVFYYQNDSGSKVFFDDLGPPWPKHECSGSGRTSVPMYAEFNWVKNKYRPLTVLKGHKGKCAPFIKVKVLPGSTGIEKNRYLWMLENLRTKIYPVLFQQRFPVLCKVSSFGSDSVYDISTFYIDSIGASYELNCVGLLLTEKHAMELKGKSQNAAQLDKILKLYLFSQA
ncbi:hypothetical protein [Neptunomonas qingdaonensis]|uniref:Uncharacterized protein n=1 Tax=Neptunomonas qingdaonensis TaxID=1045558 RepID=A0A1I2QBZ2_9GAMM|nr:hypothetical protein [Neptunomonas qingdaonensis]SFG23797.1 hypothetical protein SAMN05216175_104254 [Neptunomonas qingdaonensis]